jgi:Uma2 family endonuclease
MLHPVKRGALPTAGSALTLARWADLPEDVAGELVDGRLEEEEMPTTMHELVVSWLIYKLMTWLRPRGGWAFGSDHKLGVSSRRGRKPDVSVYLGGRRLPAAHAPISRVPPFIAVEVVTARPRDTKRDRVDKPDEYARFGIAWYWLVDPAMRTVEVFELGADRRYVRAQSASGGRLRPRCCRGLVLDLDELWRGIDELPRG